MLFKSFRKVFIEFNILFMIAFLLTGCGASSETPGTQPNQINQSENTEKKITFKVVTPSDPNSIPLLILDAKEKEWMENIDILPTVAPAGDPGAMSALLHSKEADFALFNTLGGAKNYANGIDDLMLMGVHIWKGIYLLTTKDINDLEELNGANAIAVPGVGTTPHAMASKMLAQHQVKLNFGGMGPGLALWTTLSKENSDIKAIAAPEPIVSMILLRQQSENWPNKFKVDVDLAEEFNPQQGTIPLGALFMVDKAMLEDDTKSQAVKHFLDGLEKSIQYMNDPANHKELSQLLVIKWKEVFGQDLPERLFETMLSSGRIGADYRPAYEVKDELLYFWQAEFDFSNVKEDFFYQKGNH